MGDDTDLKRRTAFALELAVLDLVDSEDRLDDLTDLDPLSRLLEAGAARIVGGELAPVIQSH